MKTGRGGIAVLQSCPLSGDLQIFEDRVVFVLDHLHFFGQTCRDSVVRTAKVYSPTNVVKNKDKSSPSNLTSRDFFAFVLEHAICEN